MSYKRISAIPIIEGGTGAKTLTGVLIGNGTSAITGNAVTQYNTLVGGASNAISSIAPSATAGIPLVSGGSSANPSYTTAVVAGGGTGTTSFTAYAPICGGTTTTGALQVASTGLSTSGYVLTSNGSSALPSFQAASGGGITTINGDSGSVTGSTITITGGSSGAVFTGSSATLTESFNYLSLPTTTSSNGQIKINGSAVLHTYGTSNTFLGVGAGNFTTTGTLNTGIGENALQGLTSGSVNTAIGFQSGLSITSGTYNTAIGAQAMQSGSVTGGNNIGIGFETLNVLVAGSSNVAIGSSVLSSTVNDSYNIGIGAAALQTLNGGVANIGIGENSLQSLANGSQNIALGTNAGLNYVAAESSNILMNNSGVASESNVLRIGSATGTSAYQLNAAYICGIQGITVTGTAVLISSSNQLGVAISSSRFKDNIEEMGEVSSSILNLRPVTFNYKVGDDNSKQTGLIAEEVAEIMPSLVVYDKEGLPQTVKYHDLPALLLNELQKAVKRIEVLENKLSLLS